jgi:hypothetical protein
VAALDDEILGTLRDVQLAAARQRA